MEREENLYDKVEILREFTYNGDIVIASGGCEAAMTARITCGLDKFWACGELLYGRRFPLRLKWLFIRFMQGQQCCKEVKRGA